MPTNAAEKRPDATLLTLNSKFTFGRYKKTDKTVADVVREDPEYLIWANQSVDFIIVPVEILAMCYDKSEPPAFKFTLEELRTNISALERTFEGASIPGLIMYPLLLMKHLHEQFIKSREVKLKLDE